MADAHGVWKSYFIPSFSFLHPYVHEQKMFFTAWKVGSGFSPPHPSLVGKLFQAMLQHTAQHEKHA